ncbi:MAG: hypothetical protein LBS21_03365 [Clostridiales bacterium]|jgi:hypothetical protein|nr:hypothetical protein [Clostridiales bacterium]
MKEQKSKLTEWVINKIKNEYADDVALLVAVEGVSVNGDGHGQPFDYFVPATERGNELSQTFIIDGVGNDLYPRSWERTRRTADLEDLATLCLGNAKILYSRSKEDEEKFEKLRERLFENLANGGFVYKKALENLDVAMDLYKTMMFEDRDYKVRALTGFIFHYLSVAVAFLNGTYLISHHGLIPEITNLKNLPEHFAEYYKAVLAASSTGELKSLAHLLISSARQFIAKYKPAESGEKPIPDFTYLADWYQELRTTWNRIYYHCKTQNADAAFDDACNLQNELAIVSEEFSLGEMNLLGCFDSSDLKPLAQRAEKLENEITAAIEKHGVTIRRYNSLEEFLAKNP